jgi:ABC-type nickel/cobalt efflux system permease component RcnA
VPTLLSAILLGFLLGMRHATDTDHVIAVSTIVGRERKFGAAAILGALWGMGHTATVGLVGAMVILFGVTIPAGVAQGLEFGVGLMLIGLGIATLVRWLRAERNVYIAVTPSRPMGLHPHAPRESLVSARHAHTHGHGDFVHSHRHGHGIGDHGHPEDATPASWLDRHLGALGLYRIARPVLIGVVHGLAGSAAVALLALGAIRDPWWGMAYLLVFGLGTMAGMVLITMLIAAPFAWSSGRLPRVNAGLQLGSGLLSLLFGLALVYGIASDAAVGNLASLRR